MTNYLRIKLALSAVGLGVLIWGLRVDNQTIRWVGIVVLAASVLMRFLPKRLREGDYPRSGPPAG